ncbi:MAG: type II toxin-antitoxin system HicA family toxin [Deltaproteobacteria bacterium]|nr:type II toxin-antitoxin system HicA family toxin [Deltaproteobacteria bacterium]
MTRLRRLAARDLLRAFASLGFHVAGTRGSHAKPRRVLASGETQTLTIPLHRDLAPGTVHAIFRKALRYVPEADLRPWFFSDER